MIKDSLKIAFFGKKTHKKTLIRYLIRVWCLMPGGVLLSHGNSHTIIGAEQFHFRVRDGIGWVLNAIATEQFFYRLMTTFNVITNLYIRRRYNKNT